MSDTPSRLPARLLLLFSLAVLLTAIVLYLDNDSGDAPAASLLLTQASWQETEAPATTPPPSELDSASLPARWQLVSLPFGPSIALLRQARAGASAAPVPTVRVTWLKVSVDGLPAQARRLALYGARVKTDGTIAVYVNGRLAHQAQISGPSWNSTRTPLWFTLPADPGAPPVHEILLRLEHSPASQTAVSTLHLGPEEALRTRYHVRLWLQQQLPAMLSAAFLAVGVFALCVWLRRQHEIAYLLFFNLAVTTFLRGLHFYIELPVENGWFAWLTVNSLFWLVLAVHYFLCQLHQRPLAWLTRLLVTVTLAIGVLTLPALALLPNMPTVTPLIYIVAPMMSALACVVGGICAWRHSAEGRLVVYGIVACTLMGMSDWLLQNNVISAEGWYLGAYTPAVCFITFGVLMYRRYVAAIVEVERVNASLAERLARREAELEASHQRLRDIELRQTISDERQRLMQDMHDGLGSSLIGAIRSVERGGLGEARVAQILKDCLDDLKLTIDSMEPVEADLLLLLATLRFRLEPRLEGSGVRLLWAVRETPALPWLNPSSALHILRIVQESIANILRHTSASEIRVDTNAGADGVQVHIIDNGAGFNVTHALRQGGGRGLQNQQRRAAALDGRVDWQSDAGGTRFTLWLPLTRPGHS
ncbi:sensor histidine kinase [Duganella sp. FT80W]|uniref:histidine kinase n=1 Tax=Duganella guangzhouensis TaxID=2666084 RepID=A0A6I2L0X2_9BURK|nr:ATP-binding protein [Duganella guangzhouensis]MRW91503.1 sensor histidine kinase [Duganella guangzhouensis]